MKKLTSILLLLSLVFTSACASSKKSESKREITQSFTVNSGFSGINASGNVEIEYTSSPRVSIKATGTQEALKTLKIYTSRDMLHLEMRQPHNYNYNNRRKSLEVKLTISGPTLRNYKLSGNSSLEVKDGVEINGTVTINTSGNSELDFEKSVSCENVSANSSGNSEVEFDSGVKCSKLKAISSGNSEFTVKSALCDIVSAISSGNSTLTIKAINAANIAATSSGNSDLTVSGKSNTLAATASGNSSLNCSGVRASNTSTSCSGNASLHK